MESLNNKGTVKFFLQNKGYGFILCDTPPNEEIFFHVSGTLDSVVAEDKVIYDIEEGDKGLKAVNIKKAGK